MVKSAQIWAGGLRERGWCALRPRGRRKQFPIRMNRMEAIQPVGTSDLLTCAPADIDLAQLDQRASGHTIARLFLCTLGAAFFAAAPSATPAAGTPPAGFDVQFRQLCDTACREINSGKRTDSFYRDSYAIRALGAAWDATARPTYLDTCRRWAERMIEYQAQMIPKGAYYMHYGRKPGQANGEWFVGDSSSIALGVLAAATRTADPDARRRLLDSVETYARLVIDNYVGPGGGITDGLWSKFDGEWWCSTGIFGSLAFLLHAETGKEEYRKIGLGTVDWLNRLDFADIGGPIPFEERPPTVVMYMLETYSIALPQLDPGSTRHRGAMTQLDRCLDWMSHNQRGRVPTLAWDYNSHKIGAKFGGLPFHMYVNAKWTPDPAALRAAADQELRYIATVLWKDGPPAITQLAVFAMLSYAERLHPGAIYRTSHTGAACRACSPLTPVVSGGSSGPSRSCDGWLPTPVGSRPFRAGFRIACPP